MKNQVTSTGVTRRTAVQGLVWSVPVVAAVVASPAYAASGGPPLVVLNNGGFFFLNEGGETVSGHFYGGRITNNTSAALTVNWTATLRTTGQPDVVLDAGTVVVPPNSFVDVTSPYNVTDTYPYTEPSPLSISFTAITTDGTLSDSSEVAITLS